MGYGVNTQEVYNSINIITVEQENEFTCAGCNNRFTKLQTDSGIITEFDMLFPSTSLQNAVLVCDDCYDEVWGLAN